MPPTAVECRSHRARIAIEAVKAPRRFVMAALRGPTEPSAAVRFWQPLVGRVVPLVGGVALAVSPWVLGFAMIHSAAIVCAALGIVVVLSSNSGIWTAHQQPSIPPKL